MSCFIVSDNHIHTILSYVFSLGEPNAYIKPLNIKELEKVGNMFLKQNHLSYNFRYDLGDELNDFVEYKFKKVDTSNVSPIQFIKLLDCLNYQCCETSDYEETETYTKIQGWIGATWRELQEYKDAEWCID